MSADNTKRIFLWSGPRNISTTLMYSFAQRSDTRVYDEPLYGAYLSNTDADEYHPDANLIMKQMECDPHTVTAMMNGPHETDVVFFKNMTHHLMDLDLDFTRDGFNIILTRDPVDMLPSFDKVIPNPSLKDVGYAKHIELKNYFDQNDIPYLILDSKEVLLDPESVLRQVCERIDIPFESNMLHWEEGPRPEDGIWAQHWYSNIHRSTGFIKYKAKEESFPEHLNALLEACQPLYDALLKDSALVKADSK